MWRHTCTMRHVSGFKNKAALLTSGENGKFGHVIYTKNVFFTITCDGWNGNYVKNISFKLYALKPYLLCVFDLNLLKLTQQYLSITITLTKTDLTKEYYYFRFRFLICWFWLYRVKNVAYVIVKLTSKTYQ